MSELTGNAAQIEAITHGSGPMLVLAGPGSGKTFVITRRIAYLIEHFQIDPSKILVITFTKAASLEMKERFLKLMDHQFYPVNFGTFHAIYYSILKQTFHYGAGSIVTEHEKKTIAADIIHREKMKISTNHDMLQMILSEISTVKNLDLNYREYQSTVLETEQFQKIYTAYSDTLKVKQKVDFDDMVCQCLTLLQENPDILLRWQKVFSYILIDEFQDISPMQFKIIQMLALPENNLFIVGDDDQSIYGFRGARPDIMLSFPKEYSDCRQVLLNVNYRSSGKIVEAASQLIEKNQVRFSKQISANNPPGEDILIKAYETREEQFQELLTFLKHKKAEKELHNCAVIMRTNAAFGLLTEMLSVYQIPFFSREKIVSVYDHFMVQDFLAYLSLAAGETGRDNFFRIMNRPLRYISRDAVRENVQMEDLMKFYGDKPYMLEYLRKLQTDLSRLRSMPLYLAINYIRKGMGYDDYLKQTVQHDLDKTGELMEIADNVQNSARAMGNVEQWKAFMEHLKELLEKAGKEDAAFEIEDRVTLTTMHGSKGLEYKTVYIPDCNEGYTPYRKARTAEAIEEERRMFYVAMTRAKEKLVLQYVTGTKEKPSFPSRFLSGTTV